VDPVRVGRAFRALRLRLGLRQQDIATRARVSQQHVSDFERGQLGGMRFDDVRAMLAVVDARLVVTVSWRGGLFDRLLDEGHAAIVTAVAARLRAGGWNVLPEVTYAIYRQHGSIDILAWHAPSRTLLVVEVKTEIASAEELLRRHDEKVRLGPQICRERFDATPASVGRLLVVADTGANRRRVARLDPMLSAVYPRRGSELTGWLRRPTGAMGGLLFVDAGVRRGAQQRSGR
jgi:transcriptional regulator with XRE-family HTH domain